MAGYQDTRTVKGKTESERIIYGPALTKGPSPAMTASEYNTLKAAIAAVLRWFALLLAITLGVYFGLLLFLATLNSAIESELGVTSKDVDKMNREMRERFERMRRITP